LAASLPTLGIDGEADNSPPRSIAARTLSPTRIVETPNNPFDNTSPDNLFISPRLGKWDLIVNGSHSTSGDGQEDINRLFKKLHGQNERDMQDIPGYVERKYVIHANLYAKERLLERQAEQRQQKAFKMLQDPGNKQKLPRPLDPRSLTSVPIGLSFTSEDWMRDSHTWNREHIPDWSKERRIVDVVSDDDKMHAYYYKDKKLYKVPQRHPKRTDKTYEREDRNLTASLSRNAAAAAAAADRADPWE
jgi:hypothetical protein